MVESSDLQAAIQRTQATERIQALQNQQEELERKRFELTIARRRAEKSKKAQDLDKAHHKRVVRDKWDRDQGRDDAGEGAPDSSPEDGDETTGGIDVRV